MNRIKGRYYAALVQVGGLTIYVFEFQSLKEMNKWISQADDINAYQRVRLTQRTLKKLKSFTPIPVKLITPKRPEKFSEAWIYSKNNTSWLYLLKENK